MQQPEKDVMKCVKMNNKSPPSKTPINSKKITSNVASKPKNRNIKEDKMT